MVLIYKKRQEFDNNFLSERQLLKFSFFYAKLRAKRRRFITLYRRSNYIGLFLLNFSVRVYNGRVFRNLLVSKAHLGYCVGEFSFTRRYGFGKDLHKRKKKKVR